MRVYLPSTLPAVAALLRAGRAEPVLAAGYAVTPGLREWYASGDLEELEYIALTHAARASLRLLAADPGAPRRRVVLAVDVADRQVRPAADPADPALVSLTGDVRVRDIASGHVDDPVAQPDIAAAVSALAAADAGDDDARFAVDGAEGFDLQWYATQELGDLAG